MRKPTFCICKNKDADQLCGNREADQCLCFRYNDSKIPLLPKSEISSIKASSVAVQPGLCRTWSETPKTGFLTRGSFNGEVLKNMPNITIILLSNHYVHIMLTCPSNLDHLEPHFHMILVVRKPVFWVSDQVPQKPGCAVIEYG